jgi:hypothetical protein
MSSKSERESVITTLVSIEYIAQQFMSELDQASTVFSAMLDDLVLDAALQSHHEVTRSRAVCQVCNTRCDHFLRLCENGSPMSFRSCGLGMDYDHACNKCRFTLFFYLDKQRSRPRAIEFCAPGCRAAFATWYSGIRLENRQRHKYPNKYQGRRYHLPQLCEL